ncbi:hypothetical protein PVA38_11820 [Streptococcus pneumoniae D39]|nr:hypothetical protein PVA38_11820 [Streptococcus pneumoniae D39]
MYKRQGERGLTGAQGEKGDRGERGLTGAKGEKGDQGERGITGAIPRSPWSPFSCLLYTSDAADEARSVDLGGRGIIIKK